MVEAILLFDGKNNPLNYFIEGCEEARFMLPDEAESQLIKIIRTRIVGEALFKVKILIVWHS